MNNKFDAYPNKKSGGNFDYISAMISASVFPVHFLIVFAFKTNAQVFTITVLNCRHF